MATRDELVEALSRRYGMSGREEKTRILDEFVAVTGFHRKHATRLLRGGPTVNSAAASRPGRRLYDDAVHEALVVLWEASDRICGKRLKPLLPTLVEAMERHGHLDLAEDVRCGLLSMSAATIDLALRGVRKQAGGRRRRRPAASSSVRRSIPVRTHSDWHDPPPGFVEADLVAHSGPVTRGSFVQALVLTDIATGWTECAPLLFREQTLVSAVLTGLRKLLPFDLLGFNTDNDSVFMNETVRDYCRDGGIVFTRCRPWRKNDQAFVEQKNGAVVRHMVGYRRLEGPEAVAALSRLYATARLFVNFFQPSFKLAGKTRDGARVRKRYHPPATPFQRLLADSRTPQGVRDEVNALFATLDPILLLRDMRRAQQRLVDPPTRSAPCQRMCPRSKSSSPACEQPGRKARYGRRRNRPKSRNVAGAGPTRWRTSPTGCGAGSKPSRGGPAGSCSSGCRRSARAAIPTSFCVRCNAGSRSGATKRFTTWCSARTVPKP